MVVQSKRMEIDTFNNSIDKDEPTGTGGKGQTPKHCNKRGGNRMHPDSSVPNFQPRSSYPAYPQSQHQHLQQHQHHTYRQPGLYHPNQRGPNAPPAYYGHVQHGHVQHGHVPSVMVSPGGYMRHHGSYPYEAGGGDFEHPQLYGQQQYGPPGHHYHHPMYAGDLNHHHNNKSMYDRQNQAPASSSAGMEDFSRTVSSSFGENNSKSSNENKGHHESESSHTVPKFNNYDNGKHEDDESLISRAASDRSWKLLNQVASIEAEEEQVRIENADRFGATYPTNKNLGPTSSKNDNQPTFSNMPTPSKLAPLNSLSSIASAQEPLETNSSKDEFEILQCQSSGSLLFNSQNVAFSKRVREDRQDNKGDVRGVDDEIRRAASDSTYPEVNPSMKEYRHEAHERPVKKSRPSNDDLYDQPPSYTFSLESTSSFSNGTLPALPEKSRESPFLAPMGDRDRNNGQKDELLAPSNMFFEDINLKGQDSFTEGLVGSSFTFDSNEGEPILSGRRSVQSNNSQKNIINKDKDMKKKQSKGNDFDEMKHDELLPPLPGSENHPPVAPSWSSSSLGHRRQNGMYPLTNIPPYGRNYGAYQGHLSNATNFHRSYTQDNSSGRSSPASTAVNSIAPRYGHMYGPYGTQLPRHVAPSDSHLPPSFQLPVPSFNMRVPPPPVYMMSSPPGGRPTHNEMGPVSDNTDPTGSKHQPSATGGVYNWTKSDDARLSNIMKKFKNPKDWESISKEFGKSKTAKECHERWIRYLKPGVRKGQWQDYEDAIVVEAVSNSKEQPFTRWSDLAQRLPGRVGKQIRDRWVNHLNPNINHMPFTREDDLLLWEGHSKLGKRWVEISSKYFNSSRSENHIKNRWYSASFKKFVATEFGPEAYNNGKKSSSSKGNSK